eukprot:545444-Pelagomonas_calceolata.AAC.2
MSGVNKRNKKWMLGDSKGQLKCQHKALQGADALQHGLGAVAVIPSRISGQHISCVQRSSSGFPGQLFHALPTPCLLATTPVHT